MFALNSDEFVLFFQTISILCSIDTCFKISRFYTRVLCTKMVFHQSQLENWPYHFIIISGLIISKPLSQVVTTVGYGNQYPTTDSGRIFTIVFALLFIPLVGYSMGIYGALFRYFLESLILANILLEAQFFWRFIIFIYIYTILQIQDSRNY